VRRDEACIVENGFLNGGIDSRIRVGGAPQEMSARWSSYVKIGLPPHCRRNALLLETCGVRLSIVATHWREGANATVEALK